MSKAKEFAALAKDFEAVIAGQDILKDEIIQVATERMMLFIAENMGLMGRALRLSELVDGGEAVDLLMEKTELRQPYAYDAVLALREAVAD